MWSPDACLGGSRISNRLEVVVQSRASEIVSSAIERYRKHNTTSLGINIVP